MTDARTTKIGFGKRLLTAAASLVMLATCAVTAMPAHAANTAVAGGSTTFKQYLTMSTDAKVPNATITYTVTAGTATGKVSAGIDANKVSVTRAVFDPNNTVTPGLPGGATGGEGKQYATQTVTVDLSQVSFSAPGIYRYTITRNDDNLPGITASDSDNRTLDVYVTYEDGSDSTLKVEGYILQTGLKVDPTAEDGLKSDGYIDDYATQNLTLTKNVTGNQGDRDKYFKFTVTISGAVPGTKYDVAAPAATSVPSEDRVANETNDSINKTSLTVDKDGNVNEAVFYLKDDDNVVIKGLTSATHYTITEADYSTDGYTTTNTDNTKDGKTTGDKTMGTSAHTVTFINAKQGSVPTGILLDVAPYIVLVALVGVGLIALLATKKRRSR